MMSTPHFFPRPTRSLSKGSIITMVLRTEMSPFSMLSSRSFAFSDLSQKTSAMSANLERKKGRKKHNQTWSNPSNQKHLVIWDQLFLHQRLGSQVWNRSFYFKRFVSGKGPSIARRNKFVPLLPICLNPGSDYLNSCDPLPIVSKSSVSILLQEQSENPANTFSVAKLAVFINIPFELEALQQKE